MRHHPALGCECSPVTVEGKKSREGSAHTEFLLSHVFLAGRPLRIPREARASLLGERCARE